MPTPKPKATTSPWVRQAASAVHGLGLYARKAIPKDTHIIEYVGERITKAESNRRDDARLARQAAGGDDCTYLFEINQRHDIDGAVNWNTARLINHSCEPNCETDVVRSHIWISALRDIAAGEELTYDYGFDWDHWRGHPCRCGAANCFGYIVKRNQRWRVKRALAAATAATG